MVVPTDEAFVGYNLTLARIHARRLGTNPEANKRQVERIRECLVAVERHLRILTEEVTRVDEKLH